MSSKKAKDYKVIFNHDGFCLYSNQSPYQDITKPVGVAQVKGYIDEVADAGCDAVLFCPNMYYLPGWVSDHYPYWQNTGKTITYPDTIVGKVLSRCRDFILSGNDAIALSLAEAKKKNIDFFLTFRINECHGNEEKDENHPGLSDFYRKNPQFRMGEGDRWGEKNAFNFAHEEVRDYQFGFIEELMKKYDVDGLDIDLLRWPYLFPQSMPFDVKAPILTDFMRRIRAMLKRLGRDIPVSIRIFGYEDLNILTGIDLATWLDEGLVDIVQLSTFYVMSSVMDMEFFRKKYPKAKFFVEFTQSTEWGKEIELSAESSRKPTRELLRSTAASYLDRGADGISLFNFVYYRDYSFGNAKKLDRTEPEFGALRDITDRKKLAKEAKHYYVGVNHYPALSRVLPVTSAPDKPAEVRMHIADDDMRGFSRAVVRIQTAEPYTGTIRCDKNGSTLTETLVTGELFPNPYREVVPKDHSLYHDFDIPLSLIVPGWNTFTIEAGGECTVRRMEIALYRKDGYSPK
ncbi:MAG: hypothetical protein AABZ39_19025 [Spirochaetota bacterium]